jgi:hypothetical protein
MATITVYMITHGNEGASANHAIRVMTGCGSRKGKGDNNEDEVMECNNRKPVAFDVRVTGDAGLFEFV